MARRSVNPKNGCHQIVRQVLKEVGDVHLWLDEFGWRTYSSSTSSMSARAELKDVASLRMAMLDSGCGSTLLPQTALVKGSHAKRTLKTQVHHAFHWQNVQENTSKKCWNFQPVKSHPTVPASQLLVIISSLLSRRCKTRRSAVSAPTLRMSSSS